MHMRLLINISDEIAKVNNLLTTYIILFRLRISIYVYPNSNILLFYVTYS